MAKPNEPEQLELDLSPVCKTAGCMQEQYFKSIRELQATIEHLEKYARHHDNCMTTGLACTCGLGDHRYGNK